ncbi:MAG: AAA family ATPase [Cyanobacteria bacterium]|nr:AAA family ATPase [Cyanobacteria bacterium GSL.Bin1]
MTTIISTFNQSGGVGKTTVTYNLGYELSQLGYRMLLVDFDPQASLTLFLGVDPIELKKEETIYTTLIEEDPLPIQSNDNLNWVPSNIFLSQAEIELIGADMRDFRLKEGLSMVQENYDLILIDCPPSLGILSYLALVASSYVIVPIIPEFKSLKGVQLFLNTYQRVRRRPNPNLKIGAFLPWGYDKRTRQGKESMESINANLSQFAPILTAMGRSVIFSESSQAGQPISQFCPSHRCAKLMQKIAAELIESIS